MYVHLDIGFQDDEFVLKVKRIVWYSYINPHIVCFRVRKVSFKSFISRLAQRS